jgi:hypothetical protein
MQLHEKWMKDDKTIRSEGDFDFLLQVITFTAAAACTALWKRPPNRRQERLYAKTNATRNTGCFVTAQARSC